MKRVQYSQRGPVPHELVEVVDFEAGKPGENQVLIEVLAAPINPSDVLTITGEYGALPPLPAIGGNEGVGKILAVGPGAEAWTAGEIVLLPVGCGTWATHVMADAGRLVALPTRADPVQLSMLSINPPTAALLLSDFVSLEAGDWVIQNAANSAVGSYVVQLARARGYRTVNVVRREAAADAVRQAGGEIVLVEGPDLPAQVKEATGGAKIRLAIDAVGGASTEQLARCLAEGGTLVNYGAMSGQPCQLSPASFVFRDLTLRGFWLARWFRQANPQQQYALFRELAQAIERGDLHAKVQATFKLEDIGKALQLAAAGERDGKILMTP